MSILNMNAESYRKFTQAEQPVLVEFSAPWCVYCRRLAPALESVAEEYRDSQSPPNSFLLCSLTASMSRSLTSGKEKAFSAKA